MVLYLYSPSERINKSLWDGDRKPKDFVFALNVSNFIYSQHPIFRTGKGPAFLFDIMNFRINGRNLQLFRTLEHSQIVRNGV